MIYELENATLAENLFDDWNGGNKGKHNCFG